MPQVRAGAVECVTESLPPGREMEPYQSFLQASNGVEPYAWSVLPPIAAWGNGDDGQTNLPADGLDVGTVAGGLDRGVALLRDGTVYTWGSPVPPGLHGVRAVASGSEHTLALLADGTVAAWGNNLHGQSSVPSDLGTAAAVSAGVSHSLALLAGGTVCAWGDGSYGQLDVPPDLTNVIAIAAGGYHALALKADGTVAAWGYNCSGQVDVPEGLSNVVAIAAGCMHSLALLTNGTVVAWGDNAFGQAAVPALPGPVAAVACGGYHSLALGIDGTITAWGNNWFGQASVPPGLERARALAAGMYFSLALPADDTRLPEGLQIDAAGLVSGVPLSACSNRVMVTVRDQAGEAALRSMELVIASNSNARPVIAGVFPPSGEVVMAEGGTMPFSVEATDSEGSNLTCRWTLDGATVGTADPLYEYAAAWDGAGLYTVRVEVSDGLWTNGVSAQWTLTVLADGDADGLDDQWEIFHFGNLERDGGGDFDEDGSPDREEFANGTDPAAKPVRIATPALPDGMEMIPYQAQLAATNGAPPFTWALVPVSSVSAWGGNWLGQAAPPGGLSEAAAIAAGAAHNLALTPQGTVAAWGDDRCGQSSIPAGLAGVAAVAGGWHHSLAVRTNGSVVAWGRVTEGQCSVPGGMGFAKAVSAGRAHSLALLSNGTVRAWGDSADGKTAVPTGLVQVIAVSAGAEHSLALLSNGTVRAWGADQEGQVTVPPGLTQVTAVAAGAYHNLALLRDGTVTAWGYNDQGQAQVPAGLSNVIAVAAGGFHSVALLRDGGVVGWGDGTEGQLPPAGLTGLVAIAAGTYHTLALGSSATRLSDGLSLSPDGLLSGRPLGAGTNVIRVSVRDDQGTEDQADFRLVIAPNPNQRPVIDSLTPEANPVGLSGNTSRLFEIQAHDPESAPLAYRWTWDGAGVGGDQSGYTVTSAWSMVGSHLLRCVLSDGLWTNSVVAEWAVRISAEGQANLWLGGSGSDWFSADNWSLGTVPADGMDVVVPAGTACAPVLTNATAALASFVLATGQVLTVQGWDSVLTARELTLSGTVTHATNWLAATNGLGEWIPQHRVWLAGSNITLCAKGRIDVSNRGYVTNAGPGRASLGLAGNSSPGHAGPGRRGRSGGVAGPECGEPAAPVQPGSGGSLHANSGFGGGAVRIAAEGQVTIEGTIAANGQNGAVSHGTGGAGGSIWITCRTIAGSTNGLLSVNGGNGNNYGAGASAGRLSLCYDPEAQAGLPDLWPAIRFSGVPGARGSNAERVPASMGTLYVSGTHPLSTPFADKRFQSVRLVIPAFSRWNLSSLTLDDCSFGLPEGVRLAVSGDLCLTNGAALHVFAAPPTDPGQTEGAVLEAGSLRIASNSWLHPYADPGSGVVVRVSVSGDLEVAPGGGIDADGKGFLYGCGPGAPVSVRGGGGYGGRGGQGYDGASPGSEYGTDSGAALAGSGGGQSPLLAGRGGGAIRLLVGNRACVQGTLTASGEPGIADHGPGGSGGGISIECRTFEGSVSGLVRAEGGLGSYYGGSGGGGRIAILYQSAAQAALPDPCPPVRFSTYAYPYSAASYEYPNPAGEGSLFFPDTGGLMATPTSAVSWTDQRLWHVRLAVPDFTNWAPAALALSNCAVRLPEGFRLDVAGGVALGTGALLRIPAAGGLPYGARLTVGGDLAIESNAWIQPFAHPVSGALVDMRVGGDARIAAGGGIASDARGYAASALNLVGPGAGTGASGGGGYGGRGGGATGGATNGSAILPLTAGSPGGWRTHGDGPTSGNGGGGIHLRVDGRMTLNGTLSANGGNGGYYAGPGGSGGAILLTTRNLSGTGVLRARGGAANASVSSGSGGGGRIAVWDCVGAEAAASMIASGTVRRLLPAPAPEGFTGLLQIEGGATGTAGDPGTAGFYRLMGAGALIVIW